jgi:hypothetical protein
MVQVPLRILITDSSLLDHPDIQPQIEKLKTAGHDIVVDDGLKKYDFITGPNAWLLRPEVANLFTLAVTNARKIANADKERSEQVRTAKASKAKPKRARAASARVSKVKGNPQAAPDPLPGQLDYTTDPEADSFSAGG